MNVWTSGATSPEGFPASGVFKVDGSLLGSEVALANDWFQ